MIQSLHFKNIRTAALLAVVGLLVVSCGSYQSASYYDNDGIYSNGQQVSVEKSTKQVQQPKQKKGDNTYAQYFGQKADEYQDILESEIFTDIDSYSSDVENDSITETDLTDYYNPENDYAGYGGWGDNPSSVSINIYNSGFNNWGGYNYGWANPFWGWNNWGYGGYGGHYGYGGYGWGWNRWNYWNHSGYAGWGGYAGYGYAWSPYYGYGNRGRILRKTEGTVMLITQVDVVTTTEIA